MSQRDIFSELMEGFAAMQAHREAKLSQYHAKLKAKPVAAPAKTDSHQGSQDAPTRSS
ncbi:MAG: hypothetical protein ACREXG_07330 [Polaromonas sp.]